jgi:hypothetical protein
MSYATHRLAIPNLGASMDEEGIQIPTHMPRIFSVLDEGHSHQKALL